MILYFYICLTGGLLWLICFGYKRYVRWTRTTYVHPLASAGFLYPMITDRRAQGAERLPVELSALEIRDGDFGPAVADGYTYEGMTDVTPEMHHLIIE